MSCELDMVKRLLESASFALTRNEMRVVMRALGNFVSEWETGRPEDDGDINVAIVIQERLGKWSP